MDLIQVLVLCSMLLVCTGQPWSHLIDFTATKSMDRLHLLRNVEKRVYGGDRRHPADPYREPSYGHNERMEMECGDRLPCPSFAQEDAVSCLSIHDFCNQVVNCPGSEDENPVACLFFKMMKKLVNHKTGQIWDVLREKEDRFRR